MLTERLVVEITHDDGKKVLVTLTTSSRLLIVQGEFQGLTLAQLIEARREWVPREEHERFLKEETESNVDRIEELEYDMQAQKENFDRQCSALQEELRMATEMNRQPEDPL